MAEEGQSTENNTDQQATPAVPADGQQAPQSGEQTTPPTEIMGKNPTETQAVTPTEIMGKVPEAVPQEQQAPQDEAAKTSNIPASYTAFQNAPEGFVMDQGTTQLFQKAGLTQDGAQALVDGLRERQKSDATLRQQQTANQHNENITILKQDIEFGGMHYEQTLKDSSLGLNRINVLLKDDGLTKLLTDNNLQTHPSIVKLFSMIEKWHGEKGFITSDINSKISADANDPMSILGRTQANEIMNARKAQQSM